MNKKINTKKIFISSLTLATLSISTPSFSMLKKVLALTPLITRAFSVSKPAFTKFQTFGSNNLSSRYFSKNTKLDISEIFAAIKNNSSEEINQIPNNTDFESKKLFEEGYTLLTLACLYCDSSTAESLLKKPFIKKLVNTKDKRGRSPLDYFPWNRESRENLRFMKLLIENGATPSVDGAFQKLGSYLALYTACICADKDFVKLLFEKTNAKEKINYTDPSGMRVLDYVLEDKNSDLAEFLILHGAKCAK